MFPVAGDLVRLLTFLSRGARWMHKDASEGSGVCSGRSALKQQISTDVETDTQQGAPGTSVVHEEEETISDEDYRCIWRPCPTLEELSRGEPD